MTSIRAALQSGRALLAEAAIADATVEAEVLLMDVLGANRAYLYTHPERLLSPDEAEHFDQALARRLTREPTAYVAGEREFFGHLFQVDRRVLIPRPETETLVETALDRLRRDWYEHPVLADVGTGSGAIAVTLALACPNLLVDAVDLSADALAVAAANVARHRVGHRVRLIQGDLLAPVPEPVDLVVANLPYIPTADIAGLEPEVRVFEPVLALDGGPAGLNLIARLLAQAPSHLRAGGAILLEVAAGQGTAVCALAAAHFPGAAIRTVRDLAGHERVVVVSTGR